MTKAEGAFQYRASASLNSCLSFLQVRIMGMCCHAQPVYLLLVFIMKTLPWPAQVAWVHPTLVRRALRFSQEDRNCFMRNIPGHAAFSEPVQLGSFCSWISALTTAGDLASFRVYLHDFIYWICVIYNVYILCKMYFNFVDIFVSYVLFNSTHCHLSVWL